MFPFLLVQSASTKFLLMTHRVDLNRSSKCANMRYRKNQVFYSFTINSQSKPKKFSTLFLRHVPGNTRYEVSQGFMVDAFTTQKNEVFH